EGMMLTAALVWGAVGAAAGTLWVGIPAAMVAGAVAGLFLAFLAVSLRVEQVVAGVVINIAAAGVTAFVFRTALGGSISAPTLSQVNIPVLSTIPGIGPIFFQQSPLAYV